VDAVEPTSPVGGLVTAPARRAPVLGTRGRPRQWRIRCQDVANRERFLTLFVEHGRVVLVGPPGESAVLTAGQLGQLRVAPQEAADEAER
jgi:hypothetical protein